MWKLLISFSLLLLSPVANAHGNHADGHFFNSLFLYLLVISTLALALIIINRIHKHRTIKVKSESFP